MTDNKQAASCWSKTLNRLEYSFNETFISKNIRYPEDGNHILKDIEKGSFWYRHRNNVILTGICGHIGTEEGIFLEVGAGNGFVSAAIRDSTRLKVACIEPDPDGVAAIRRKGILDVSNSPLRENLLAPKSIAGIGMFDVLEHVPDQIKFLNLAKDALADGGKLFVTVPAYQWLWSIEDKHDGHIRRYSMRGLTQLLNSADFSVDYATYFFTLLPLPILMFRTLPSVLRLGSMNSMDSYKINREVRYLKDHAVGSGWRAAATRRLFSWESLLIRLHLSLPFGGSIMAIATKRI